MTAANDIAPLWLELLAEIAALAEIMPARMPVSLQTTIPRVLGAAWEAGRNAAEDGASDADAARHRERYARVLMSDLGAELPGLSQRTLRRVTHAVERAVSAAWDAGDLQADRERDTVPAARAVR